MFSKANQGKIPPPPGCPCLLLPQFILYIFLFCDNTPVISMTPHHLKISAFGVDCTECSKVY